MQSQCNGLPAFTHPSDAFSLSAMCNRYLRAVALGEVQAGFSDTGIPLRFPEGLPNLGPTDVCITDTGTIIRAGSDEPGTAELVQRRWSWPGPTGKPVFNYR